MPLDLVIAGQHNRSAIPATPLEVAEADDGIDTRLQAPETFFPSSEDIQREIEQAISKYLSPTLEHWSARYAQVGHRQNHYYLWRWARQGVEVTMLSSVDPKLRDEVCDTKVLGVMLDVLVDDVADRSGNEGLLECLLNLPFQDDLPDLSCFSPDEQAYAQLVLELWREIHTRARRYPRYQEFAAVLRYDYVQLFNTMRYSHLLNRNPALLNVVEHDLYLPHNMHMMVSATLDLMCSSLFDAAETGHVREAAWLGQCMGRIGNLTTTWERELGEGDFTSGVYARALMQGDLTPRQLRQVDREAIRAAIVDGQHEAHFLARWQEYRRTILAKKPRVKSVDLNQLALGLQRLICLHLGSRGYK
jgi:hypothetical protein